MYRQLNVGMQPFRPTLHLLIALFSANCALPASAQYAKFRLYDFEEGTGGGAVSSVPDTLTDPFIPGTQEQTFVKTAGPNIGQTVTAIFDFYDIAPPLGLSEKEGIRNFDSLSTIQNTRSQPAPAFSVAGGSPNYVDISAGSGLENTAATELASTRAVQLTPGDYLISFGHQNYDVQQGLPGGAALNGFNVFRGFNFLSQAWIRPDAAGDGTRQIVFNMGDETGGVAITTDGKWEMVALGPAGVPEGSGRVRSSVDVAFNDWTHVAVLRTGVNALMYINGSLAATLPPTGVGFFNNYGEVVTLGTDDQDFSGSQATFNGLIDNFSIAGPADGNGFSQFDDLDWFADTGQMEPTGVLGDVDQDGDVDADDYEIWSENVGFNNGFNDGDIGTLFLGDVDTNGTVDFFDFRIIQREAAAAGNSLFVATPEPAAGALVALAAGLLFTRRRRVHRHDLMGVSPVPQLSGPRRAIAVAGCAAAVLAIVSAKTGSAQVVVAEDFFYPGQATKIIDNLGPFGANSFGGGQNGDSGTWESRWVSSNASTISTDTANTRAGIRDNPFTGVANMLSAFSALGRNYTLDETVPADQTLYFAADFAADLMFRDDDGAMNAHYGIMTSSSGSLFTQTPLIGIGITGPRSDAQSAGAGGTSTFFAQLGDMRVQGNVSTNANDFTNDGAFHRVVGKIEINANGASERLTAWLDPTGVETGPSSVLQAEADIITDWADPAGDLFATLFAIDLASTPTFKQREHYFDNVAIGTTWESVQSVDVPRLTLRVNTSSGVVELRNDTTTDLDISYYEIRSTSQSLNSDAWNSLADQDPGGSPVGDYNGDGAVDAIDYAVWRETLGSTEDLGADGDDDGMIDSDDFDLWQANYGATGGGSGGWLENSAVDGLLIESNFDSQTTLAAGASVNLGAIYDTAGTQDLVARWGASEGALGLLNVANVVYVSSATAAPEPHSALLLAICLSLSSRRSKK